MATTFVEVLLQLRDELGADTLSGGKIYTYEAGTSTPLVTYQDRNGATANTNPVILDSAGMAQIRQTDGMAYKWIIYDADDNLLWTRDYIIVGDTDGSDSFVLAVTMNFEGTPAAQGWMGGKIFNDAVTFAIDFEGAQGSVETVPGSTFVISIRKNGVEVGTASISTDGVYTFASTGAAVVEFEAGDKLTFIGPSAVGSAANFIVELEGAIQ